MDKIKDLNNELEKLFRDLERVKGFVSLIGAILSEGFPLENFYLVQLKCRLENLSIDSKKILEKYGNEDTTSCVD